ncbi:MAG TPA: TAXI family TRAP transporter solute-binding subunit [Pirellulaceae bacterium]|nr:TAXI family TRAP transporter solute-binding subunit [Pirellulaceae bacterium]HMO92981.1 TAXI family TRAP transporter solute-binding subunit [Pirellulaceae bacterium]HMP67940.1 TAXI family TRAP transporter solute-binding subunit [Pirellulaceae bacterium]
MIGNKRAVRVTSVLGAVFCLLCNGCNPDQGSGTGEKKPEEAPRFISMGTAPSGGAFFVVGNAIASVLTENRGSASWTVQPVVSKGTQQNIRDLDKGDILIGMSNAAIGYYAVNGEGIWDRAYRIRSICTLAPNIGVFITKSDSGIMQLSDLKGKRVAVGPAGAGFEAFLGPILTAHGVEYTADSTAFTAVPADYSVAVQLLGDGDIDAAFIGGAIPTPAVVQAATTMNIRFINFDETIRRKLIEEYEFFQDAVIPARNAEGQPIYKGLDSEYPTMNVGSMQLITHADVSEALIYEITKIIWENRQAIAAQHPAGRSINESNVAKFVGTEFHPGAIRFYKEIGIWQE